MPELPEVETVKNELRDRLLGRIITKIEVRTPKMLAIGTAALGLRRKPTADVATTFAKELVGKKLLGMGRRAKLLVFEFSGDLLMLVHLKMTGQFIHETPEQKQQTGGKYRMFNKATSPLVQLPYGHTHVIFTFDDGSVLFYNDVRQFGYLRLLQNSDYPTLKEIVEFGPEPLEEEFTEEYFREKVKKSKLPIKQLLMDNSIVVGIGNIYSDEILFHAKVDPRRRSNTLNDDELRAVFKQIRPVLEKGIKEKGSSVGDFVRPDGSWGSMGKHHYVYGKKGQSCLDCGSQIESVKLGGRTSSFCPNCQK